jgi:hypothetical protein
MDPSCDSEVRHGGRYRLTMFTKQVSRSGGGLDPHRGRRGGAGRANSKKDLVMGLIEVFVPYRPVSPDNVHETGVSPEPESSLPMNGRQWNERPPHVQELPYRQITTRQFDVRTLNLEPDPDRWGVRMGVLSNHNPLDFSPLGFVR